MLFSLLFSPCPGCGEPARLSLSRYCRNCLQTLASEFRWAEALPEEHLPSGIESLQFSYRAIGQSYSLLRAWKSQGGIALERRIRSELRLPRGRFSALVPVPPRWKRAWDLRGGTTPRIASWLSQGLRLPVASLLLPDESPRLRQAQLRREERFASSFHFGIQYESAAMVRAEGARGPLLLVDDFLTTGKTLESAAEVLARSGFGPIHAFCLAWRPHRSLRQSSEMPGHLVESA